MLCVNRQEKYINNVFKIETKTEMIGIQSERNENKCFHSRQKLHSK